jgi:hypothetical protein
VSLNLRLLEIALVLVRLDHGAIEVQSGEDPQMFAAFVNARA